TGVISLGATRCSLPRLNSSRTIFPTISDGYPRSLNQALELGFARRNFFKKKLAWHVDFRHTSRSCGDWPTSHWQVFGFSLFLAQARTRRRSPLPHLVLRATIKRLLTTWFK